MEKDLQGIEQFFNCDINIKKILYDLQPKESDKYNSDTVVEYADKLYNGLKDIEFFANRMISYGFNGEKDYCNKYFKLLEQELVEIGTDFNKLSAFYKIYFSDMREELVNEVGENCKGHCLFSGVSLKKAKSINELLHIMHQSVINNNNILESMNKISSKKNTNDEEITLYGEDSEISRNIYDSIPLDMDCGVTDILSLKDRIIMMVRDRGHALSIEIEQENGKYYIKYFIPKICNTIMINNLKGVKKVDNKSTYTVGIIETTRENICGELIDFISKVPTDDDMFIEGGKFYKEDEFISDTNTPYLPGFGAPKEESENEVSFHM